MSKRERRAAVAALALRQRAASNGPVHCKSLKADVAQLVEQPIRNALSLAYVVVEYGGFRVVFGGSRVSLSTVCTAFCTAI
jgi:hypothetical protein